MQPADVVGDDKYTRSTGTIIPHHNLSLEILLNWATYLYGSKIFILSDRQIKDIYYYRG